MIIIVIAAIRINWFDWMSLLNWRLIISYLKLRLSLSYQCPCTSCISTCMIITVIFRWILVERCTSSYSLRCTIVASISVAIIGILNFLKLNNLICERWRWLRYDIQWLRIQINRWWWYIFTRKDILIFEPFLNSYPTRIAYNIKHLLEEDLKRLHDEK